MTGRVTGFHVAAGMVAFFSVIVAVNLTMAMLAAGSWTGLVVKNSYVASQQFNDQLARAEFQMARGYVDSLSFENGQLRFDLRSQNGLPIDIDTVSVTIGRPVSENDDRTVQLARQSPGSFAGDQSLKSGLWVARIAAVLADGEQWRMNYRFVVKSGD